MPTWVWFPHTHIKSQTRWYSVRRETGRSLGFAGRQSSWIGEPVIETLSQEIRWTVPEEWYRKLVSQLHMHLCACSPLLMCIHTCKHAHTWTVSNNRTVITMFYNESYLKFNRLFLEFSVQCIWTIRGSLVSEVMVKGALLHQDPSWIRNEWPTEGPRESHPWMGGGTELGPCSRALSVLSSLWRCFFFFFF